MMRYGTLFIARRCEPDPSSEWKDGLLVRGELIFRSEDRSGQSRWLKNIVRGASKPPGQPFGSIAKLHFSSQTHLGALADAVFGAVRLMPQQRTGQPTTSKGMS